MRFSKEMHQIAWELETIRDYNVLQCVYGEGQLDNASQKRLEKAHYRKIERSDGIYVADIEGYIGNSVRAEIEYAIATGKEVLYHSKCIDN